MNKNEILKIKGVTTLEKDKTYHVVFGNKDSPPTAKELQMFAKMLRQAIKHINFIVTGPDIEFSNVKEDENSKTYYHNAIGEFNKSTVIHAVDEQEAWKIAKTRWKHHFGFWSWYKYKHTLEGGKS